MPENMPVDTAAVSWFDGQVHIRVYSSDGNNITERCWDGDGWYTGSFAAQGGQVSATCWVNNGIYIRVYCNFEDRTTEWCWDGNGWYQGGYTV
jgi:hypothetical protein